MARFIYIVTLTTYMHFANLTVVTHGACSAGEVRKYMPCSSVPRERVNCPVEDMGTRWTATIVLDEYKNCKWSYGTTTTGVWTADGCSALFEICGEAMTTAISEIPGTSQTDIYRCFDDRYTRN